MQVYLLKHPDSGKTGVVCGVDFYGGKGTTSSLRDAKEIRDRFGCELFLLDAGVEKPIRVIEEPVMYKLPNVPKPLASGLMSLKAEVISTEVIAEGVGQPAPSVDPPTGEASPAPQEAAQTEQPKPKRPSAPRKKPGPKAKPKA